MTHKCKAPRFIVVLTLSAVVLMSSSNSYAGGYQLNEHGAQAVSMGGAFVARAWDASAIYFNPAGISLLRGINVMAGGTLILPSTTFTGPYPNNTEWKMNSLAFFPPNAYVTYNFNNGFSAGVGVFTPEGLGTDWPQNWVGKFIITKVNIQSFDINPTIAYTLGGVVSVGVGFDYVLGNVVLDKDNPTQFSDASGNPIQPFVDMKGNGNGAGFNFGVLLKPYENISLGFSYRNKIDFKIDNGTATYTGADGLTPLLPSGAVTTSLPFPETWYLGIAYEAANWSVEADYQYVGWSAYKELSIAFANPGPEGNPAPIVGDYNNSYILRVGGDYIIDRTWTARAGILYDRTPVPAAYDLPILPDADRLGINVGVGVNLTDHLGIDASYMFLPFKQRTITSSAYGFDGTYNTTANLIGLDLRYSL
ncbi:MAG: outer membrane protein transport protein [Bacteroidetes bacterium]|nr:outer membrane protein transport protein [Bacteroidota bacterium]